LLAGAALMLFSSSAGCTPLSSSDKPILSLRISAVDDRKSASSSISDSSSGSSFLKTSALNVPVAAVHSGFGGGSTKTWLTSAAAGLNSSASSGMASSSSRSPPVRTLLGGGGGAGGGADAAGAWRLVGAGGLV
jgi:hypothetical protein